MILYTLKTFFRNKKRAFFSILFLSFVIGVSAGVLEVSDSSSVSLKERNETYYGRYASFRLANDFDVISSDIPIYGRIGKIKADNPVYDEKMTVGTVNPAAADLMPVNLEEGVLPKCSGEASVEKAIGDRLGIEISVGNEIKLFIKDSGGVIHEKTLLISGILSGSAGLSGSYDDGSFFLPSVILFSDDVISSCDLFVPLTTIEENSVFINPSFSTTKENRFANPYYGQISIVMAVCLAIAFVACLIAFFAVEFRDSDRHVHLLRLTGKTHSDLYIFTFVRIVTSLALSLIPSLLLSLAVLFASSGVMKRAVGFFYRISFSIVPIVLTTILIGALATAISFFRLLLKLRLYPLEKKIRAINATETHCNPIRKLFLTTSMASTGSLSGIIVASAALFVASTVAGVLLYDVSRGENGSTLGPDYIYSCSYSGWISSLMSPEMPFYGSSEVVRNELSSIDEISSVGTIKRLPICIKISEASHSMELVFGKSVISVNTFGKDVDEVFAEFGLDEKKTYYRTFLYEMSDDLTDMLYQPYEREKAVESLKDGKHVAAIVTDSSVFPYKIGDTIDFLQIITGKSFDKNNSSIFETSLTISSITQIEVGDSFSDSTGMYGTFFVIGEGAFQKNGLDLPYTSLLITLKDPDRFSKTEAAISRLLDSLDYSSVSIKREEHSDYRIITNILKVTFNVVIISITALVVLAYGSMTELRFRSDRKKWGTLRSLGFTGVRLASCLLIEPLMVVTIASFLSLVLDLVLPQILLPNDIAKNFFGTKEMMFYEIAIKMIVASALILCSLFSSIHEFRSTPADELREL